MSKRKAVEAYIIDMVVKITKSDFNKKLYQDLFKSMNNQEFDAFMHKLKDGDILNIIVPHDKGVTNITVENNFKLMKSLGSDFFQHATFTSSNPDIPDVKSKYRYYNLLLPFRRTKQTSDKGLSVADSDKKVDSITGQVIGDSQTSKLSYPEVQVLNGMGLNDSVSELLSDRGGSNIGRILKQSLLRYGSASEKLLKNYDKEILSSKSLKAYFNGMHLQINP